MTYQLWLGDCLEEMSRIEAGSIDMILADLPYGTTACKWDVIIPFEPLWKHYKRVIKRNGAIVLFGTFPFTALLWASNPDQYRYKWVWDKSQVSNPQLAKIQPLRITEDVLIFGRERIPYNPQGLSSDVSKVIKRRGQWDRTLKAKRRLGHIKIAQSYTQEFTNYPKDILRFPQKRTGLLHPTQKPVALLEYLIKTYSNESDLILDNTMGSGSTGEACLRTSRRFIGIEKDQKYFEIAQKRLEKVAAELSGEFVEKKSEESHPRDSEWLF